jgi:transposase
MRTKGSPEELQTRRQLGARLLQQGHGVCEVAEMIGVRPCSVSRWKQILDAHGVAGLTAKRHPGPRKKLSDRQRQHLPRLLLKGPSAYGYQTELWTFARVAAVIEKEYGVHYDPSQVYRILKDLGWSSQKPERRAREHNEQAIAQWRRQDWRRIKKRPKKAPKHRHH